MIGQLNNEGVLDLLKSHYVGHLGYTVNGQTIVVPVSYAYADNAFYCHSLEGQKIAVMRQQPQVCFEVEDIQDHVHWQTVICQCEYEEIITMDGRKIAMQHLLERKIPHFRTETVMLSSTWPFHDEQKQSMPGVLFRLHILSVTSRFENFEQKKVSRLAQ